MNPERPYHHGSLREAALAAAQAMVEQRGHNAVSMRDLAVQLGVAPSALYRHYSSRVALLTSLANSMHEVLTRELEGVIAKYSDPWACLAAAGQLFLVFAQRNGGMFRMMYDDEIINAPGAEEGLPALKDSYELLLRLVRQALPGASAREARLRLIGMWSTLFGYASVRAQDGLKSYMLQGLSAQAMEQAVLTTALGPRPSGEASNRFPSVQDRSST